MYLPRAIDGFTGIPEHTHEDLVQAAWGAVDPWDVAVIPGDSDLA